MMDPRAPAKALLSVVFGILRRSKTVVDRTQPKAIMVRL
jgi:hypothetical protein